MRNDCALKKVLCLGTPPATMHKIEIFIKRGPHKAWFEERALEVRPKGWGLLRAGLLVEAPLPRGPTQFNLIQNGHDA